MSIELKVPEVAESVSEVQIGDWVCAEGAEVERDQSLVAIETDKVTVEILAPMRGRLVKIILQKGVTARVGDVVGLFESQEGSATDLGSVQAARLEGASRGTSTVTRPDPPGSDSRSVQDARSATKVESSDNAPAPWASPAARRALLERGLRAEDVTPSSAGRLLKEDVARHKTPDPASLPQPTPGLATQATEEIVKMSPLRLRVAERLLEAQHSMALLTTFNEIDLGAVQQLRQEAKASFLETHGIKLGLMSFFVRATLEALKAFPVVNAEVRGTDIVYKNHYDIGIAVGGGRGLVVPVLRNVERLGFAAIERAITDFSARAKENKLELRELTGGTFTISNGGVYGSMLSTPIVNPPQSAILGLHAITDRPVARGGQVVIRPMMYVALTYDHRIVDGREAVSFLLMVKDLIENPIRMLLEI
jgi:2-oxoglutarate dehydrogenase E2 component (dihydrolipoamide succinyltransferase)